MSPREKKLLLFFGLAGFLILNLLAFNFYTAQRVKVQAERAQAEADLRTAEFNRESSDSVRDEMDWLAEHEPEPTPYQEVQADLQQLAEREAVGSGLTIKSQRILPAEAPAGAHFNSVKVQLNVSGSEQSLYLWFSRLNTPTDLRAVTFIRLAPDREDDTKIDCTAIIEQMFVPLTDPI